MRAVPPADTALHRTRDVVVIIDNPQIVVMESPDPADSAAVQEALELLVKWAVRAHQRRQLALDEVATTPDLAASEAGKQA